MIGFVITIKSNKESVKVAERCIESGKKFGEDIRMFDAITPERHPIEICQAEGIPTAGFEEKYSRNLNCISAFLSHYSLWKKSAQLGKEIAIFEHDAVLIDKIPTANYLHVMNIGKPSYGKFITPATLGVNKLTTKPYFPGAHAYLVRPEGAMQLIYAAKKFARPTDVFLNKTTFPWLEEYYPFAAEARDTFTTIQNTNGCQAKHNFNEDYRIIDA